MKYLTWKKDYKIIIQEDWLCEICDKLYNQHDIQHPKLIQLRVSQIKNLKSATEFHFISFRKIIGFVIETFTLSIFILFYFTNLEFCLTKI